MAFQRKLASKTTLISAAAFVSIASLALTSSAHAAQPAVSMGTTSTYAVLAGSGITNTGPTTVSGTAGGDLGSSPTGTFTGDTQVTTTGTKFTAVVAQTTAAKADLVLAYDDAAGRVPVTSTITADLASRNLTAGVYKSASELALNGVLTLDAQGDPSAVFIFQAGSTLITGSGSSVVLANGAQACNVFWQVGSSATFGTTSDFSGHVIALESITANTNAIFHGQLLARNGAVTLDTNTIVNDSCLTVVPTDTATPTPTATSTGTPSPTTTQGGGLPNTDAPDFSTPLLIGLGLAALGSIVLITRRKRS